MVWAVIELRWHGRYCGTTRCTTNHDQYIWKCGAMRNCYEETQILPKAVHETSSVPWGHSCGVVA